ncbi:thioredoxin family protein [Candidatus Babeliales bacterium]|nr:thioredoxin family protein [Candidatus Babeliales bacterium]
MIATKKLVLFLLSVSLSSCVYSLIPVMPDTLQQHVYDQEKPVIVLAYAHWCTVCEITRGFLDNIYPQFEHRAVFAMLEVNQNPEFAIKYTVNLIPTFLVFYHGQLVCEHKGFIQPYKLRSHIELFLSKIEQKQVLDEPFKISEITENYTTSMPSES